MSGPDSIMAAVDDYEGALAVRDHARAIAALSARLRLLGAGRDLPALADLARREGVSQAEVIREAIGAYRGRRVADRNFRLAGVAVGPGLKLVSDLLG